MDDAFCNAYGQLSSGLIIPRGDQILIVAVAALKPLLP